MSFEASKEIELDGVFYAQMELGGQQWRMGAVDPAWRIKASAGASGEGVWLGSGAPPAMALMCCGLGSMWPGMGRELYAAFPEAARAMDAVGALADWDILGLMDEAAPERISQSRLQIPYLFMLECAQWRVLRKLGAKPQVICGHSLGELIALCCAGVYDLRSAWHLLETRARHMADLEARGGRQGGMLAVPADEAEIAAVLEKWPELRISNRNTRRQFILSGPRAQLLEARKALRRKRIPAIMLPMDIAFHNPAMRVLRDISIRRLNGLRMDGHTEAAMLSCVSGKPYPLAAPDISREIADLDENAVDWVNLIEILDADYGIGLYLELGPQETLCGITGEIEPGAQVIAVDKKGHEAEAMREALARLFAAGLLDMEAIAAAKAEQERRKAKSARLGLKPAYSPAHEEAADIGAEPDPEEKAVIYGLIAEVAKIPAESIEPGMELRRDLALRSASFPFLMMEAEQRLGRQISLANLFQLTTVADLACFLSGKSAAPRKLDGGAARPGYRASRLPLARCRLAGGALAPAWLDAAKAAAAGRVKAWICDPDVAAGLLAGLAAGGFAVEPGDKARSFMPAAEWEARQSQALPATLLYVARPVRVGADAHEFDLGAIKQAAAASPSARKIALRRFIVPAGQPWLESVERWAADARAALGDGCEAIAWLAPEIGACPQESGDLLAWECKAGGSGLVIWDGLANAPDAPRFCPAADCYLDARPLGRQSRSDGSAFYAACQISAFAEPALAWHGADALYSPLRFNEPPCGFPRAPWLPLSAILAMARTVAQLQAPWLEPAGFTDFHMLRACALPEGITREFQLAASPRLELPLAGAMARLARVAVAAADLTSTGRKTGAWTPVCDCVATLRNQRPPLAESAPGEKGMRPLAADPLYDALGFGAAWRFLEDIRLSEAGVSARFVVPEAARPDPLLLVDAALQGAMAALGLAQGGSAEAVAARLNEWRFAGIGFAQFGPGARLEHSDARLVITPAWRSDSLARFHVCALLGGDAAMAIHNLEFDRVHANPL